MPATDKHLTTLHSLQIDNTVFWDIVQGVALQQPFSPFTANAIFNWGPEAIQNLGAPSQKFALDYLENQLGHTAAQTGTLAVLLIQFWLNNDKPEKAAKIAQIGLSMLPANPTLVELSNQSQAAHLHQLSDNELIKALSKINEANILQHNILFNEVCQCFNKLGKFQSTFDLLKKVNTDSIECILPLHELSVSLPDFTPSQQKTFLELVRKAMQSNGALTASTYGNIATVLLAQGLAKESAGFSHVGLMEFPENATLFLLHLHALEKTNDPLAIVEMSMTKLTKTLATNLNIMSLIAAAIPKVSNEEWEKIKRLPTPPHLVKLLGTARNLHVFAEEGSYKKIIYILETLRSDGYNTQAMLLHIAKAYESRNSSTSYLEFLNYFIDAPEIADLFWQYNFVKNMKDRTLIKKKSTYRYSRTLPSPTIKSDIKRSLKHLESLGYGAYKEWRDLLMPNLIESQNLPKASLSVIENKSARLFREFIRPYAKGNILDIGCGIAKLPYYLSDFNPHLITGIDPITDNAAQDFSFYQGVAECLPWKNHCFDNVVIGTSIDHFLDPEKAIEEARRVVKPSGNAFIWSVSIPGSPEYDPWDDTNAPIDKFHLFHTDEKWFLPMLTKYFTIEEAIQVDATSVFYAACPKI